MEYDKASQQVYEFLILPIMVVFPCYKPFFNTANVAQLQYIIKTIRWRDQNFSVGSCVFLNPGSLIATKTPTQMKLEEVSYF